MIKPLITTIEADLVIRQSGALVPDDHKALGRALANVIGQRVDRPALA